MCPILFRLIPLCILAASVSAQPLSLAFRPVDVQFSNSLDRLVMISTNPSRVYLVHPTTGATTSVNLSLPPLSLSVSPDGTHAAVGHDGWISYVNLPVGYVEKNLAVPMTVNVVLLAGNGKIWVPPSTTVDIATGTQTTPGYSLWGRGEAGAPSERELDLLYT
jgi:hypothetical protein